MVGKEKIIQRLRSHVKKFYSYHTESTEGFLSGGGEETNIIRFTFTPDQQVYNEKIDWGRRRQELN